MNPEVTLFDIVKDVKLGINECNLLNTQEVVPYSDFIENLPKKMKDIFAAMPASLSDAGAIINLFYSVTMHVRAGEPTFNLSKDLIGLLQKTDLPKFNLNALKLPFPAIMIGLAQKPLVVNGQEILSIYLIQTPTRFRIVAGARDTSVIFVNLVIDPQLGVTTIDEAVQATVTKTLIDNVRDDHRLKPVLNCMDLFSDDTNDSLIDKLEVAADALDPMRHTIVRKKFFDFYHNVLSLAINAVLYITSPDADMISIAAGEIRRLNDKMQGLKKGAKRENFEKLLAAAKKRKIYIVGGNVHSSRELDAELTETGRKMVMRHQVRGHWKYQPYGPKNEMRKHIWLQPYWRGPSYAEMLARNYVVRENKESGEICRQEICAIQDGES
jgi:hypothetical protein